MRLVRSSSSFDNKRPLTRPRFSGNKPQEQDNLSRRVMRAGLEWGCPFVLYWEMYNNEVRDGRQRGFWLIDKEGRKQPVYFTLQQYYRNARVWVTDFLRQQQRLPTSMEFDGAAVRWLQ